MFVLYYVSYGRKAEVAFTNNWHLDAVRRDLTVNSLFLGNNQQLSHLQKSSTINIVCF